jgi:hypothetical protein
MTASNRPRQAPVAPIPVTGRSPMTLLLLEALAALVLLIFIVWWTMFSGRKNGELPEDRRLGGHHPGRPDDTTRD